MAHPIACVLSLLAVLVTQHAFAQPESDTAFRVSTVAHNGMPKNIVPRGSIWNFGSGSLRTYRGWQYAAYWDDARQVSVARRQLPSGKWSVASLPGYQRTENVDRGKAGAISRGFGDGHEKVSMGISADGVIHLAFDHHLSTLHYRCSVKRIANEPSKHDWTPELFGPVRDNLGGPKIERVTYPSFTADGNRLLLYLRLNGGSGDADSHFMEYENGRWLRNDLPSSKLIDKQWSGGDGTVNAYPHSMVVRNGRRHLTWSWRDTPTASTSHDLCYSYSDDHGETWRNSDGKPIGRIGKKFITADSDGVVAINIPAGTSFVNGGSMTVDQNGRVHVVMRGESGEPFHATRDPETGKWDHGNTRYLGALAAGNGEHVFLVSEGGLHRLSASRVGEATTIASAPAQLFRDGKTAVDRERFQHDGWISAIGQRGKRISVVDFRVPQ